MDCTDSSCLNHAGVLDPEAQGLCLGPTVKGFYEAISFLIFMAGALGNLSVVVVVMRSFQELSSTDLFLVGLAAFDFLASIFLPLMYFLEIAELLSVSTDGSCRFLSLMYEVSVVMSIYILLFTVYTFYRKVAFSKPDDHRRIRFIVLFGIAFVLAALPAFPYVSGVHAEDGVCHVSIGSYSNFVLFSVVLFIIQVILPILVFTLMFVRIGAQLYQRAVVQPSDVEADVALIERSRDQRKVLLLLYIVAGFYMFYIPYAFSLLWFLMDSGSMISSSYECFLFDTFHMLISFKCCINPILYLFFYDGFKENVRRVLCGCAIIGRRYNFMHAKYHFRRDNEDGILEVDGSREQDDHDLQDMQGWVPDLSVPAASKDSELDDREHDYDEEENQDNVAILRPWKNFSSTSSV